MIAPARSCLKGSRIVSSECCLQACLSRQFQRVRDVFWCDTQDQERYRLLRLLCQAETLICHRGAYGTELVALLSIVLHEPESHCRRILQRHQAGLRLLEERRHRWRGTREVYRYQEAVRLDNESEVMALLSDYPGSVILAAYHLGDYVHCLPRLSACQPMERKRLVIRMEAGSPASQHNQRRICEQTGMSFAEIVPSREAEPLFLRRRLLESRIALLTFCDLNADWGASCEVEFLSRRAWFSNAAAGLAIATGTPLLPVVCWHDGSRNRVRLEPFVDARVLPGENFATAVQRVTQRLVDHLQAELEHHPEQWRYLAALPRYFVRPQYVQGNSD